MPRNDFLTRPAPESEEDLEVPGQPFLGLLGILSEYYKYREPHNKQGKALGSALKYLYRVKHREENGTVDENFGLEILDAVEKVNQEVVARNQAKCIRSPVPTTTLGEPSTAATDSSDKGSSRAPIAQPPQEDSFSDFGFSSSDSCSDGLGSKIDDLVAMVKSRVKKKKRKKRKPESDAESAEDSMPEPIPRLKIRFGEGLLGNKGPRSGSGDELSSGGEAARSTESPMKLKIKLGSPLLPPPPLLTLHKPSPLTLSPQPQLSSPKYEPDPADTTTVIELQRSGSESGGPDKRPIKLTLRMTQPMRNAKGSISPRTEQMVNYIDNVTTFVKESAEMGPGESPEVSPPAQRAPLPEPPQLKMAPKSPPKRPKLKISPASPPKRPKPAPITTKIRINPPVCRKRKRQNSPVHPTSAPSPQEVLEEVTRRPFPPLKLPKSCISQPPSPIIAPEHRAASKKQRAVSSASSSNDIVITKGPKSKKKKGRGSLVEGKEFWGCGIFSNSLKQDPDREIADQLDFRSNILPIYCGINYLRKQYSFSMPYDICWANEHKLLPQRQPTSTEALKSLEKLLKKGKLLKLSQCEYVFDEHIDKPKKGRRGRKKGANSGCRKIAKSTHKRQLEPSSPPPSSPQPTRSVLSSPCESPELVIQSDCDSPLVIQSDCDSPSPSLPSNPSIPSNPSLPSNPSPSSLSFHTEPLAPRISESDRRAESGSEDEEISFGLDEDNGEALVNHTEISELFCRTSSPLVQVPRDTECDNVSDEHSESPANRNGALGESGACNHDRVESDPLSEEDVELVVRLGSVSPGARSVSAAAVEEGLLSRGSLSVTPSLRIHESPESDSRADLSPFGETCPLSYSAPPQPATSLPDLTRKSSPDLASPHKSTVTVAAITSSRTENFSVQNLSSSSNHSQDQDSDSDVSFNQDPIIKHQAKQTIQL